MGKYRSRQLGPPSLVGLAVLLNVGVTFSPNPVIDLGPIDLTPGMTKQAAFQASYSENYAIGVMMDQKTAKRMYPCIVSVEAMQKAQCKGSASTWPVALALKMLSNGSNLTGEIMPSTATAGGEYQGSDTYTWDAANIRLVAGKTYHLNVRSIGFASSLQSAQPHLVVSAAGVPGLLESNSILQIAALFAGILFLAAAAIWSVINARSHRKAAV